MLDPVLDQTSENFHLNPEDFKTVEEIARMVDLSQQGVSYHLTTGKLKRFVEEGRLIYIEDRQYFIHQSLAEKIMPKRRRHKMDPVSNPVHDAEWSEVEQTGENVNQIEQVFTRLMEGTIDRLDAFHTQIRDLSVENATYKLLSQNSESQVSGMKEDLFQLQAENKALTEKSLLLEQLVQVKESEIKSLLDKVAQTEEHLSQLVKEKDQTIETLSGVITDLKATSEQVPELVQAVTKLQGQLVQGRKKILGIF